MQAYLYSKECVILEYGISEIQLPIVFPIMDKNTAMEILEKHTLKHFTKDGPCYTNLFNQKDCEVCGHNIKD